MGYLEAPKVLDDTWTHLENFHLVSIETTTESISASTSSNSLDSIAPMVAHHIIRALLRVLWSLAVPLLPFEFLQSLAWVQKYFGLLEGHGVHLPRFVPQRCNVLLVGAPTRIWISTFSGELLSTSS